MASRAIRGCPSACVAGAGGGAETASSHKRKAPDDSPAAVSATEQPPAPKRSRAAAEAQPLRAPPSSWLLHPSAGSALLQDRLVRTCCHPVAGLRITRAWRRGYDSLGCKPSAYAAHPHARRRRRATWRREFYTACTCRREWRQKKPRAPRPRASRARRLLRQPQGQCCSRSAVACGCQAPPPGWRSTGAPARPPARRGAHSAHAGS